MFRGRHWGSAASCGAVSATRLDWAKGPGSVILSVPIRATILFQPIEPPIAFNEIKGPELNPQNAISNSKD